MNRVRFRNIEIVQSIQNAQNDPYAQPSIPYSPPLASGIPLITGKKTYARVYFDVLELDNDTRVHGELRVNFQDAGGTSTQVTLQNAVNNTWLRSNPPSFMDQRNNWSYSLNFELPDAVVQHIGNKRFTLSWLRTIDNQAFQFADSPVPEVVNFVTAQELRLRVLIFRYPDVENDDQIEPWREEVDAIRRFIQRSFPLAELDWTVVRVQANQDFYALDQSQRYERKQDEAATKMLGNLLHQIMSFRNQDITRHLDADQNTGGKPGFDHRTLYLGVFTDPRERFGGVAVDSPRFPVTHMVAAAATDLTGQTGAHELAHILGRHHPGVPHLLVHGRDIGQYQIDEYAHIEMGVRGFLSPTDGRAEEELYLGLDTGQPTNVSTAPTVLQHDHYFDLMTYRDPQWLSAYTYREIFNRMTFINGLNLDSQHDRCWTVICSYDIERKEGQILHVLPADHDTPQIPAGLVSVNESVAFDALVQIFWLHARGIIGDDFWDLIFRVIIRSTKHCDSIDEFVQNPTTFDTDREPYITVAIYNQIIVTIIDEGGEGYRTLFLQNNVPVELHEPEIRIYTNHYQSPLDRPCPEESNQYLWDNAEEVYYRRVGSIDRFSHGLLQATVHSQPDTNGHPPKSITLLVDRVVVDKFAQSVDSPEDAQRIADEIFRIANDAFTAPVVNPPETEDINGRVCLYRPPSTSLVYDIVKDSYLLNFHWPTAIIRCYEADVHDGITITTTVQCMRISDRVDDSVADDIWETVCVTDKLQSQIWISPDLFFTHVDDQSAPNRHSAKRPERPIESRKNDRLQFRFIVTVGFYQFTSPEYTRTPMIVSPRRKHRHQRFDYDLGCSVDCRYDDGTYSSL